MANASGKFISDVRKIRIFRKHSPMKSKKDFLFNCTTYYTELPTNYN